MIQRKLNGDREDIGGCELIHRGEVVGVIASASELSKLGLFPGALSRNHLPRLARNEYHVDRHADLQ